MAVTQQLARVTREHLATCSRSVDVLDRLCSFDGPDEDYLGLDWAPRAIGPDDLPVVARQLLSIDIDHSVRAISADPAQAERDLGFEAPSDPRGYIADHFHALRDFYVEAARRRLAVVVWSD